MSRSRETAPRIDRWPTLDAARGAAIAAMIIYHFSWDLSALRLVPTDVVGHPAWQLFARAIAASFLLLVGISLTLAHHKGVRWGAFWRRVAVITAAALTITIATWFAFPDRYIFFGILHCIALSSVLALPFLRMPTIIVLAVAGFCFAAPLLFAHPAWDVPLLDWLGLGARIPPTNDYVPVFPWSGFVLLGLVAGRLLLMLKARAPRDSYMGRNPFVRGLIWSGRHSLIIYLVHQPILFGALFLLVQVTGPNPAAEEAYFKRSCEANCLENGVGRAICTRGCACAVDRLKSEGLWRTALAENTTPPEREQLLLVSRQCFRTGAAPIQ